MWTALVIFGITYVIISARRLGWLGLDRPAGAGLGAVLCVAFGVLSPHDALEAIDLHTLVLLLGMMGMGAFLALDGFFDRLGGWMLSQLRTPSRVMAGILWGSGLLSALITNDAVCVLGVPLVLGIIARQHSYEGASPVALPFLMALATGANTGSVITLVGNPQNMLCGLFGGLEYADYLSTMLPVGILGLMINHAVLHVAFRKVLRPVEFSIPSKVSLELGRSKWTLLVIIATVAVYSAGFDLAWTASGGFAALFLVHRDEPQRVWLEIDWSVLMFFGGLFVVVEGLTKSGLTTLVFEHFPLWDGDWWSVSAKFLVGSNLVSNVPFILVIREAMASLPDPKKGWTLLAMASTFAGNLTLLGSVANIIVAEKARSVGGMGFFEYLKVGAPVAILTTLVGTMWILWV